MRKICFAILLLPALAWAQPRSADDWYKEGENQYNLGNFDKAVDAFKQGFSLETNEGKKAVYLFNVAQAYRQSNDCKNAQFFYKRFLALKNNDTVKPLSAKTRKDVEDRIAELEACVQQATSISKRPPNNNISPDGESGDKNPSTDGKDGGTKDTHKDTHKDVANGNRHGDGDDDDDDGDSITKPAPRTGPHVISARLTGGGTIVKTGSIEVPVQATFALIAGYPIAVNRQLTIDVGGAFTFTPVPYQATRPGMPMANETAQLIAVMANAGATYEVIPKLGLRGDVGVGALFFANVSESPFTANAPTSGALSMFHLRAALSADYAITPNILVTATPIAFTYSPPKEGLTDEITSITSIDFMVGIGYRM
jgi:tetratricopeptide (TPR) repeat protein